MKTQIKQADGDASVVNKSKILVSAIWPISKLRPNPRNIELFGKPEDDPRYEEIKASIEKFGVQEPLIVKRDGTILSGHIRYHILGTLYANDFQVPVRILQEEFASEYDAAEYLIELNVKRRQLTPEQVARIYAVLKKLAPEQGGVMSKRGRPTKEEAEKRTETGTIGKRGEKTRDAAAKKLGVSRDHLLNADAVFNTPGVPPDVKKATNQKGALAKVAKVVRSEANRQGGAIKDPAALRQAVSDTKTPKPGTSVLDRLKSACKQLKTVMKEADPSDDECKAVLIGTVENIRKATRVETDAGLSYWADVLGRSESISEEEVLAFRSMLGDIIDNLKSAVSLAQKFSPHTASNGGDAPPKSNGAATAIATT